MNNYTSYNNPVGFEATNWIMIFYLNKLKFGALECDLPLIYIHICRFPK